MGRAGHPAIMTATVVLTANHWWLDAIIAAVLVVVISLADAPIQRRLERRRAARRDRSAVAVPATAERDAVGSSTLSE